MYTYRVIFFINRGDLLVNKMVNFTPGPLQQFLNNSVTDFFLQCNFLLNTVEFATVIPPTSPTIWTPTTFGTTQGSQPGFLMVLSCNTTEGTVYLTPNIQTNIVELSTETATCDTSVNPNTPGCWIGSTQANDIFSFFPFQAPTLGLCLMDGSELLLNDTTNLEPGNTFQLLQLQLQGQTILGNPA